MVKITEEIKNLIYELNEQDVSVKDIVAKLNICRSSVYNTLKEAGKEPAEPKNDEENQALQLTLTDIFNVENYTKETKIDLIFNLRKIAQQSGSDVGGFMDDIETILGNCYRYSDNTIKLFCFIVDIANNLSLVFDEIEPQRLVEAVERFYDREISMERCEDYIDTWNIMRQEEYDKLGEKIRKAQDIYDDIIRGGKEHQLIETARLRETVDNQKEQINQLKEAIEESKQKLQ